MSGVTGQEFPSLGHSTFSDEHEEESAPAEASASPSHVNARSEKRKKSAKASSYNDKKPKWWQQLSRKATKSQRRAIAAVRGSHQLPRPRYGEILNLHDVFRTYQNQSSFAPLSLELGFGCGENLLASAQLHPDRLFMGAEIHQPGVGKLCQVLRGAVEHQETSHGASWIMYESRMGDGSELDTTELANDDSMTQTATVTGSFDNLRFFIGDGIKLLTFLPDACLQQLLVTFPDPFPDGEQWRLIQVQTVQAMRCVLDKGGRLFLATDHDGYFAWSCRILDECRDIFSLVDPCPDRMNWLPVVSTYEAKGWRESRTTKLRCWEAI